jgi:amino acid adenylation domain-containing protein
MAYILPHLLSEAAARHPGRDAARCGNASLSYQELECSASQLARALRAAGVARGDRVGICLHKSLASVIAVFGIMKAGAAYVPLDPNAPATRSAFITRNCGIRVMLAGGETGSLVGEICDAGSPVECVVLCDDAAAHAWTRPPAVVSWSEVTRQEPASYCASDIIDRDLAYILYTSGSTGSPKGVMVTHRAILTFIEWCRDEFRIGPEDRVTSHAPLHFDLSTFDLYATLQGGGAIIVVPEKLSVIPVRLVQLLQQEAVTVTYLVPSVLSMMVRFGALDQNQLEALRLVLFAGEVFPVKFLRQLAQSIPKPDYYNLYGPTETNVCTYYKVAGKDLGPAEGRPVPIGRAIANMEVYAVDAEGKRIETPGKEGELWVRGSGLASGYWGDEDKTRTSFVRNPHAGVDEQAYRTGDIVVLDEDGRNWRYVGRRDHMVKSRGYRIELGEIESVLYTHPDIKEAAVVAIPDEVIGNRLKAFVVAGEPGRLSQQAVRSHCSRALPVYMVPETVEFLDALPKTSTGKIDRVLLIGGRQTEEQHRGNPWTLKSGTAPSA